MVIEACGQGLMLSSPSFLPHFKFESYSTGLVCYSCPFVHCPLAAATVLEISLAAQAVPIANGKMCSHIDSKHQETRLWMVRRTKRAMAMPLLFFSPPPPSCHCCSILATLVLLPSITREHKNPAIHTCRDVHFVALYCTWTHNLVLYSENIAKGIDRPL